jgi:hypothetical protein
MWQGAEDERRRREIRVVTIDEPHLLRAQAKRFASLVPGSCELELESRMLKQQRAKLTAGIPAGA